MELRDRECCLNSVTKPLYLRDLPELEPKQATEIKITKKVALRKMLFLRPSTVNHHVIASLRDGVLLDRNQILF